MALAPHAPPIIDASSTVAEIATTHPHAIRVFRDHRIDFWRRGDSQLGAVCEVLKIDPNAVLQEIHDSEGGSGPAPIRWDLKPIAQLIEDIISHFHRPTEAELLRLDDLAHRLYYAEYNRHPELIPGLIDAFTFLKQELEAHMLKEERVVFRMISDDVPYIPRVPLDVMQSEHDLAGVLMAHILDMTDDLTPPEGASELWRSFYAGLRQLDDSLHEHTHVENNILFPRAMQARTAAKDL